MCCTDPTNVPPSNEPGAEPAGHESPEICSAADAVRHAKIEFEKAQKVYEELRQEAAERIDKVRETTVGDVLDGTLDVVRKRPVLGLGLAALAGFLLGRVFRR